MTDYLITLDEIMEILREDEKLKARKWLYRHGLSQFSRGKYVREQFESIIEKRGEKCLTLENEDKSITSGERCVWAKKPLMSKSNLRGLISSKMQESMQAG
jgi:hypothetical protein